MVSWLFDIAYHDGNDDDLEEWSLTSSSCNNQLHRDNFPPQQSLTFLSAMSSYEIWDKYIITIIITMGNIWLSLSSQ